MFLRLSEISVLTLNLIGANQPRALYAKNFHPTHNCPSSGVLSGRVSNDGIKLQQRNSPFVLVTTLFLVPIIVTG